MAASVSLTAYDRFLRKEREKRRGEPHPVLHAERYLRTARFEGFADEIEAERHKAWKRAIIAYMLGDDWKAPEWKADCPAPGTAGFPLTVEQVRGLAQSGAGWALLLDEYAAGDGHAEDPFNRVRFWMFEDGERERLVAARDKALEDRRLAAEELRRTARAEGEAREGKQREQTEQEIARKRALLLRLLEKQDVALQNLQPGNWRAHEVSNEKLRLQEELNRIGA